ncbi:Calcium-binding and coiled-coil domain-containing protein 1 [Goodea atripinnis]|uniref:Calcium-binding and coiled-coil domain-containing protein 1 n=1 Tax=Goodea atripinnis TaxID=208336 RepID=A0ABV0MXJ2_9TELE
MRTLRERFHMSERTVEGLKSDLSTLAAQRDRVQAELHQTRVQAAQLTIQLADASMALREGRANWAQDRQNLQHTAEELMEYIFQMEQKTGTVTTARWDTAPIASTGTNFHCKYP